MIGRRPLIAGLTIDVDEIVALTVPTAAHVVYLQVEAHHLPTALGFQGHIVPFAVQVDALPERGVWLTLSRVPGQVLTPPLGVKAPDIRSQRSVVLLQLDVVPEGHPICRQAGNRLIGQLETRRGGKRHRQVEVAPPTQQVRGPRIDHRAQGADRNRRAVWNAKQVTQRCLHAWRVLAIPPGPKYQLPEVKAAGIDRRPVDVRHLAWAFRLQERHAVPRYEVQKIMVRSRSIPR